MIVSNMPPRADPNDLVAKFGFFADRHPCCRTQALQHAAWLLDGKISYLQAMQRLDFLMDAHGERVPDYGF